MSVHRDCRNKPRRQGSPGAAKVRPARAAVPKRAVSSRDARALKQARAQADAAIAKSNAADARLRDAIDILPQGVVFLDPEERYILWNKQYAEIYKGSADQFQVGRKFEDTLRVGVARGNYPAALGREEAWIKERLSLLYNPGQRHEQWLSDGRCILIEERRTSDGGSIGLRVDITEMKAREASFRLLFDANPVPMFVCDRASQAILDANDAAAKHYGYAREQLLAMSWTDILAKGEDDGFGCLKPNAEEESTGRTWKHCRSDGTLIDVAIYARALARKDTAAVLIAAIDITERKQAEARIAHMAHHDALTGLANRVLLRRRMTDKLQHSRKVGGGVAILVVNIDNFQSVNDTLGHPCGDELLQKVADRLRATLRHDDLAARLGGDEFAVLLAFNGGPEEVGALADTLIDLIGEPYEINGQQVLIGVSIGIALSPGDGEDADRLLKNADMALYRAKADGKGTFHYFEPEMDARMQSRRRLEVDLRKALANGELQVHYQPVVELATGQIKGMEALVRWPHPERGLIPPSEFVPIAEETGLIVALGAFVLRRACLDASRWPSNLKLAVNMSPLQFRLGGVIAAIDSALQDSGLSPQRLEIEITEALLLEKVDHVINALHALRAQGVGIVMDDFGTGYSSLSYLRSFPFDRIKIDRSFVHDLAANRDSQAIVRAILTLGASLGITITAEGIETEAELAWLRAEGCADGQGYLFGRAESQTVTLALLAADAPLNRAA